MLRTVRVAVGVIVDDAGRVFVARRRKDAHLGNLWEFPGGKAQDAETDAAALARELTEEVGVSPVAAEPLVRVDSDYPDSGIRVCISAFVVRKWTGQPHAAEGQPVKWVSVGALRELEMPAANDAIVTAVERWYESLLVRPG